MKRAMLKKIISEQLDYYLELNAIDNTQVTEEIVNELEDRGLEIEEDYD